MFLASLALLTLWLLTRPYQGIYHDARLYTAQALSHLYPERFANDLFFLFGSQDAYSIFSPVYAVLIDWFGIDTGAQLTAVFGQLVWLTGAALLARRLLPHPWHWLGLALVIVGNDYYGGLHIFAYGEPFVTPRPFAEGCVLLAVERLLARRWGWAFMASALAVLLHPLIAMAGVIVAALWLARDHPRLIGALAMTGSLLAVCLALMQVAPFHQLLVTMPDAWYDIVLARSEHLFPHRWQLDDWNRIAVATVVLILAQRTASEPLRGLMWPTVYAILIGLLLTALGTELGHNALITQLQFWRVLWLGTWLAAIAAAWLVAEQTIVADHQDWLPMLGLVAAWLLRDTSGGFIAFAVLAYSAWPALRRQPMRYWLRIVVFGVLSIAVLFTVLQWVTIPLDPLDLSNPLLPPWALPLSFACAGLVLGVVLWWPRHVAIRLTGWAVALPAVLLALTAWADSEMYWDRESMTCRQLQTLIPPADVVYWRDSLNHAWFFLQRSSYFSSGQIAGCVFHESIALEGDRRARLLRQLGAQEAFSTLPRDERTAAMDRAPSQPTLAALTAVCQDPQLDWVILSHPVDSAHAYPIAESTGIYVYRCADYYETTQ